MATDPDNPDRPMLTLNGHAFRPLSYSIDHNEQTMQTFDGQAITLKGQYTLHAEWTRHDAITLQLLGIPFTVIQRVWHNGKVA